MKNLAIMALTAAFGLGSVTVAEAGELPARKSDAERKSKNGKLEANVGGAGVVVQYGRPEVRGRKVWGELITYGKLWRTGADEATVIAFDKDVVVEGQKLPAGVYALFTVPGAKEWTIVFNRNPKQWGAYNHQDKDDVLRVKVKPSAAKHTEALTFEADKERVTLRWEKVAVAFRVKAA